MGQFVKTEIEVLFFWNWIIFHWTPYHSLLHFYSKWNPHPPKPLFLCFISSTWPPVASLLLLSDPLPHKHTPSPLSPKPFLPLHLCLMMLCVTRIIQHHPQARNQTHTRTLIRLLNAGHAGRGTWISKQRTETNAKHSCTRACHTLHGITTVSNQ